MTQSRPSPITSRLGQGHHRGVGTQGGRSFRLPCSVNLDAAKTAPLVNTGRTAGQVWSSLSMRTINRQVAAIRWETASWTCLRDRERIGALNPLAQRWGAACPRWSSPSWSPAPSSRWRYFRGGVENGSRTGARLTPAADLPPKLHRPSTRNFHSHTHGHRTEKRNNPLCAVLGQASGVGSAVTVRGHRGVGRSAVG